MKYSTWAMIFSFIGTLIVLSTTDGVGQLVFGFVGVIFLLVSGYMARRADETNR